MEVKGNRKLHSLWSNLGFLLLEAWQKDKTSIALMAAFVLTSVISPFFGIYLPKLAVEMVTKGVTAARIWQLLGAFTLVMTAVEATKWMSDRVRGMYVGTLCQLLRCRLYYRFLDCDYRLIESAEGQTRYTRAASSADMYSPGRMLDTVQGLLIAAACFLLYSGVIATLNLGIVGLLVALSAVNYLSLRSARKYELNHRQEEADRQKKLRYVVTQSENIRAGKDIRLYGMAGWLDELREHWLGQCMILINSIKMRHYGSDAMSAATQLLRDGIAYAYLIWAVTQGLISLDNFVLYFGAITGFSAFVTTLVTNFNMLTDAGSRINDLRAFLETTDAPAPENAVVVPLQKRAVSIEFRDVSFAYGTGHPVLHHFNLKIAAGEKLALVGVNGAGKTTIVKLLCGFYHPDSGQILLDGVDICRFDQRQLLELVSAVFQDAAIWPFTIAENVSLRPIGETDRKRVNACLKQVGLQEDVEQYPRGMDSPMLRVMDEDGIMFSGGQQQKLLMARALYKHASILILDEPTAALDPIAESETYQRFHELSGDKTVLYISHRLASTRFCDRIVFVREGMAAESGTHGELMAAGGGYAHMFEIQSHYYKAGKELPA